MAKKKKYIPKEDDDWDIEAAKEHARLIKEKEKQILAKYRKFWDAEKRCWKKGV
jgi:hypothetical protein